MFKNQFPVIPVIFLCGFLIACGGKNNSEKQPEKEVVVQKNDSSFREKESAYAEFLSKFKLISFDTLRVEYYYDSKDKRFKGEELTLKEAKILPIGLTDNYFGKLSGAYACYQFPIDSSHIGLIARIPGEYEATTVGFFIFDRKKDQLLKEYFNLSISFGDAGDAAQRTSWLFKAKNKQFQSLVYDYSSYNHEVEDTTDHTIDEWRSYYLINCSSPKFDTLSKNETRLKKQFRNLLRAVN
ncbi:hypothetical protein [uncultured Fluviicola sp.]|uniref:hypothetical protein n=1 Tax=uncultured Fluviicola sp. TaxID=463303 RepID=UPI0025E98F71|nr:hypothetical protein [uncultured Fluviicola sp.]